MEKNQFSYHKYIIVSLLYLFIVAVIGTLLRSVSYFQIPFPYGNLVHAHSHVAFQGWVYTSLILILTKRYISEEKQRHGKYQLQFRLTSIFIIGVLVAFAIQGYGLYSIIFSTLFQILNYWFFYRFFKDTQYSKPGLSLKWIKTGIGFGLLSSLFPYVIGISSAKGLGGSELYKSLVYSFMHLQYNAWFLFIAIGLFYELLNRINISVVEKNGNRFYWCFAVAVIPAISLSLLGMSFSNYLTIPSWFSVVFQSIGLMFFLQSFPIKNLFQIRGKGFWVHLFLILFISAFILKIALQSLSVVPALSDFAFQNKLIFLSYLHLSLIGVISFLLIAMLIHFDWIPINILSKTGFTMLIWGFSITELILVFGGLGLYYNTEVLVLGSAVMAFGILFLVLSNRFIFQTK